MSTGWVRWAEMRVLEAADAGGYVLAERHASLRSRYLLMEHPRRPRLLIRVSDHRAAGGWSGVAGRPCQAFSVWRVAALAHVVKLLSRGAVSLLVEPPAAPAGGWEAAMPRRPGSSLLVGEAAAGSGAGPPGAGDVGGEQRAIPPPEPPLSEPSSNQEKPPRVLSLTAAREGEQLEPFWGVSAVE